jgi:hypothetical protein
MKKTTSTMMMIFALVETFAPFDFFFPASLVFAGFALEVLDALSVVVVLASADVIVTLGEVVVATELDLMRVEGTCAWKLAVCW